MGSTPFFIISGLWALAMIWLFISAIRICYAVERRSRLKPAKSGLPTYANVIPVAFNYRVAADEETQTLRRRMNLRLIAVLAGFVLFGVFVAFVPKA